MTFTPTDYLPYDFANRRHIGPSPAEMDDMLQVVGAADLSALIDDTLPAAIRQAALRIADIVERISETEDVQESIALNTYARAELVRLVASRIRLQAARTRVISAEELAQASARMAEGAFMEFTIREID